MANLPHEWHRSFPGVESIAPPGADRCACPEGLTR